MEILSALSRLFQLSLRDIERYITQLNVLVRSFPNTEVFFPTLLTFLLVLREKNPALYEQYCKGGDDGFSVIDYLRHQPTGQEFFFN